MVNQEGLVAQIENLNVNQAWELLKTKIKGAVDMCVPSVRISDGRTKPPWLSGEVLNMIKKKRLAYKHKRRQ